MRTFGYWTYDGMHLRHRTSGHLIHVPHVNHFEDISGVLEIACIFNHSRLDIADLATALITILLERTGEPKRWALSWARTSRNGKNFQNAPECP